MKTVLFHYTGTGNSLWAARQLAARIDGTRLVPLRDSASSAAAAGAEAVGLVFPVHIWGLPGRIVRFVETLNLPPETYLFALAINAGQVSRTLVQLQRLLAKRKQTLAAGYSLVLPSNYIPWGGPGPKERQQERFLAAREKIDAIAAGVVAHRAGPIEKGPLWQRMVFATIYRLSFKQIPAMDKGFWVDGKCTSCGLCARVCPAGNVTMEGGKPAWHHHCEQCLACLQWCPAQAIQYGKKTPQYERYHHPEVQASDIIS